MNNLAFYSLCCALVVCACDYDQKEPIVQQSAIVESQPMSVPPGFPNINVPESNPLTAGKVLLGRKLFFERALSSDSSVSCGSCHLPERGFSDRFALSKGAEGEHSERNTPSIINAAFAPKLMAEGGVKTLELQVLSPLESNHEMNMAINDACARLNAESAYRQLFDLVWGDSATPFTLTRSIASYERTLVGGNSRFDQFSQGDSGALTEMERKGLALFSSEGLGCRNCHAGILFTNYAIENNGLAIKNDDNGLFRLTLREEDIGKFKVPSLRNVGVSAPYMHDGRFNTLQEVLEHYNQGGAGHENQSEHIKPLNLSKEEKEQLIAFLGSLTEVVNP